METFYQNVKNLCVPENKDNVAMTFSLTFICTFKLAFLEKFLPQS